MNVDRRAKPRFCEPIPIAVYCEGGDSRGFGFETVAKNISAGGLYASAPQAIKIGSELGFRIRFARAGTDPLHAPAASARGKVIRAEEDADGTFHFAASFTHHRMV